MENRKKREAIIGISYNNEVGGSASNTMRNVIDRSGAKKLEIDYYQIVTQKDLKNLEDLDSKALHKMIENAKQNARHYLEQVDCLILPGNNYDVDPRLYGGELPPEKENKIDLRRAIAEMALAHVAMQMGVPVFAVCGGHQILNVYLGGKLKKLDDPDGYLEYSVNQFVHESELKKIIFKSSTKNEGLFFGAHGDVVDPQHIGGKGMVMGDDLLIVVATSKEGEGNIEAMEAKFGAPLYSIQFHAEIGIMGMYSIMHNAMKYFPPNQKTFEINFNIMKAVKVAAESYIAKKDMLAKVQQRPVFEDHQRHLEPGKKQESKNGKSGKSLHSLFRDTKTSKEESSKENINNNSNNQKQKK